jgi:hypothetical protein
VRRSLGVDTYRFCTFLLGCACVRADLAKDRQRLQTCESLLDKRFPRVGVIENKYQKENVPEEPMKTIFVGLLL